jgi:hypothetical protein
LSGGTLGFKVLTAVTMKSYALSVITYYFTLKIEAKYSSETFVTFKGLHDIISQEIELFDG